jgi:hypothetical protein
MLTQTEQFLNFIQFRGNQITLEEIRESYFVISYRRMFTELRHKGYQVICERDSEHPIKNKYVLIPPKQFDAQGQGVMI